LPADATAASRTVFLCGLFNSLLVNYLTRLRVTTHVTTAIVEQLPIPTRAGQPAAFGEIAACARVLTRAYDRPTFARLNARVAALFRLTQDEFAHVLSTFPLVERRDKDAAGAEFARIS
jgi:hypothetical protein